MKKYKIFSLLITLMLMATIISSCGEDNNDLGDGSAEPPIKTKIVIATGATNGTSYKMGKEFERILQKNNIDAEVLETEGFKKNLEHLENGTADIAVVSDEYLNGKYDLTDIGEFYNEKTRVVVGKNSDIKDYNGLKGKKIVVGTRDDFTREEAETWVNKYNTGANKVNVEYMHEEGLLEKLKDGTVDAAVMLGNTLENGFR